MSFSHFLNCWYQISQKILEHNESKSIVTRNVPFFGERSCSSFILLIRSVILLTKSVAPLKIDRSLNTVCFRKRSTDSDIFTEQDPRK